MVYRERGTVEAWQVPAEKDRRKTLPNWIADWHPGRVPNEKAIVLLAEGVSTEAGSPARNQMLAMSGDFLVRAGSVVGIMDASVFSLRYEPAGD